VGRPDFIIEKAVVLDVKAKKFITKEDYNQMMKYLTLLKKELGLIVNFRASFLKPKRILNPDFHSEHSGGHSGHSDRNAGFTLIELFFVSIFMMVISLYVVGNLNKIRTAQELQNTALDVVSKIRSTQGSVLAGKIIPDEATPPEAYELLFSPNSADYDVNYVMRVSPTQTSTTTLETVTFGTAVRITDISVDGSGVGGETSLVTISPFGNIVINNRANSILRINMEHVRTDEIKTIVVDGISGRITVQ